MRACHPAPLSGDRVASEGFLSPALRLSRRAGRHCLSAEALAIAAACGLQPARQNLGLYRFLMAVGTYGWPNCQEKYWD